MSTIKQEQSVIASKQAITAILSGSAPPPADYGPYTSLITQLGKKLASDGAEAAHTLYSVLLLNSKQLAALVETSEQGAGAAEGNDLLSSYPSLSPEARIDPALGADACKWLDAYVAFSRRWAPEAFDDFHEACGLFILSSIAARRVHIPFGRGDYTPLTIALVARTSMATKSTAARLATDVLRSIGLACMLGPDNTTPQKMLSDMAGKVVPADYGKRPPEEQERIRRRAMFTGQRAWFYEEFGMHVRAMMQEGGPMAAFHGLLRVMDDCPEEYEYSSIGRGEDRIEKPYLTLLANMTPADLRKGAKHGAEMWNDGFWARFAFVTPPSDFVLEARFPDEEYCIPSALQTPLIAWHKQLGVPDVTIEPILDDKGKETGQYQAVKTPLPVAHCHIAPDVRDALYSYRATLRRVALASPQQDLDGNYMRFAAKALRIAALFASLENGGYIQIRHWARAQAIAERMRASLHRLMEQVNEAAPSRAAQEESKVVEAFPALAKKGLPATARNIGRYAHISTAEARLALAALEQSGLVSKNNQGKTEVYNLVAETTATG